MVMSVERSSRGIREKGEEKGCIVWRSVAEADPNDKMEGHMQFFRPGVFVLYLQDLVGVDTGHVEAVPPTKWGKISQKATNE